MDYYGQIKKANHLMPTAILLLSFHEENYLKLQIFH